MVHDMSRFPLWPALFLLGACGSGQVIDVTVTGLGDGVRSLQVTPAVPGQPAWPAQLVVHRLDSFRIEIPDGVSGRLSLHVDGLDADRCSIARGAAEGDVGQAVRSGLGIALAAKDRGCELLVQKSGDGQGTVTSADGQIDCGERCTAFYPPGTRVSLNVTVGSGPAGSPSYFAGWSGAAACQGRGPCELVTADEPVQVVAGFLPRRACQAGPPAYCWENPLPQGNNLYGLWSDEQHGIWAIGDSGTILRWNGSFWGPFHSPTQADLFGIWGSHGDDVWAVGNGGTILHFDGVAWSQVKDSGTQHDLVAVWGSGPGDVWAVGTSPDFSDVVVHFDGQKWSPVSVGLQDLLVGVWGSGKDDVWIVGENNIAHFDGRAIVKVVPDLNTDQIVPRGIWGSGKDDVWIAGSKSPFSASAYHWDGSRWSAASDGLDGLGQLFGLWGTGPGDVWTVGEGGAIAHFDGTTSTWTPVSAGTQDGLTAVLGTAGDNVWAVGLAGSAVRWNGAFWSSSTSGPTSNLNGMWGSGPTDIWAAGDGGTMLRYDGASWVPYTLRSPDTVNSVYGSSSRWIWAVGEHGRVWLWTSNKNNSFFWDDSYPSNTVQALRGVWGDDPANFWAVGGDLDQGIVLHAAGTAWQPVTIPSVRRLNAVWGLGQEVWAVGEGGLVLRSTDGMPFQLVLNASTGELNGVWGSAADDIWAVGESAIHFDGQTWSRAALPDRIGTLRSVWGSGKNDVWAGDGYGNVLHFDGTAWSVASKPGLGTMAAVWGSGKDQVWFAGSGGTILHYRPGQAR